MKDTEISLCAFHSATQTNNKIPRRTHTSARAPLARTTHTQARTPRERGSAPHAIGKQLPMILMHDLGSWLLSASAAVPRHIPPPRMLRNVDRCEALIFTTPTLLTASGELRVGCSSILVDARAQSTQLSVIGTLPSKVDPAASEIPSFAIPPMDGEDDEELGAVLAYFAAFCAARESSLLTPDGFGGSDGFGQRPTSDAMARPPEPQWCVALVSDPQACEGALRAGMRVIGLPPDDDQAVDPALEGVADVCLDTLTDIQSLDDLSTPGAFWLNPCMHRDGEGYAVNPQSGRRYDQAAGAGGGETSSASAAVDDDPEDAAAAAILRDMGL